MSESNPGYWTRRRVLATAGSLAAGYTATAMTSVAAAADDDSLVESDDIFGEQAEPTPPGIPRTKSIADWPRWSKQTPRPKAIWAPQMDPGADGRWLSDGESTDTLHLLPEAFSAAEFALTSDVLKTALELASIDHTALGKRVLFGVRGARRVVTTPQQGTQWTKTVKIAETAPDHFHPRCVLGVWNRTDGTLWTGPGSTVPNVAYMYAQAQALERDKVSNLLPAGVYRYRVGTHRNGARSRQPGAFRLDSEVVVQRNYLEADVRTFAKSKAEPQPTTLAFSPRSLWKRRGPDISDNIHAALVMPKGLPRYAAAGCQVIEGTVTTRKTREHPMGAWREFRIAAGLKADPSITVINKDLPRYVKTDEDGRVFYYVLLTARELRLAAMLKANDRPKNLRKLRRGSSGPRVEKLQRALQLRADGAFGAGTQDALIRRQLARLKGAADGVLTEGRLERLGLPKALFD